MITNYDTDEATFKAGYSFAQSGLDINTAWEKFVEVNEQIKKNAMKHPITGEERGEEPTPEEAEAMSKETDYPLVWEK